MQHLFLINVKCRWCKLASNAFQHRCKLVPYVLSILSIDDDDDHHVGLLQYNFLRKAQLLQKPGTR